MQETTQSFLFTTLEVSFSYESRRIIGQPGNAQPRGEPEGGVQSADHRSGPKATDGSLCLTEIRDDPSPVGHSPASKTRNDTRKFRLGETIQEEMRHDQVVAIRSRLEFPYISNTGIEPALEKSGPSPPPAVPQARPSSG